MKNFICVIGICVFVLGLGTTACKSNRNVISGKFSSNSDLSRIDENLVEKKWTLTEINGVALSSMDPKPTIEAFIIFQVNENRVSGNSGCNNFSGTYKSESGGAMKFSGVASTRRMCLDMTIENQMNKIFGEVDNYSIQNGVLILYKTKTALAKFEVSKL